MSSRTLTTVQASPTCTWKSASMHVPEVPAAKCPSLMEICLQTLVASTGPPMRKLDQVSSRLPEEIAQCIMSALAKNARLTDDRLSSFLSISRRVLHLEGCGGIRKSVLRQIPFRCPHLTYLDLSNCVQVSNTVVRDILQGCTALQKLKLDNCRHITDAAFQPDQSLFCPLRACLSLKVLSLAGCSQITHSLFLYLLKAYRSLTELNVSRCKRITNDSIKILLTSSIHFQLQKLNLSFTDITDEAFSSLSSTNLKEIDLGQCKITDATLFSLAQFCPNLEVVKLRYCSQITDAGIVRLAAACPNLRHVDVTNCGLLTDVAITALGQCMRLQSLNVAWCVNITDVGMTDLVKSCPYIKEMVWTYCSQLTDVSVNAMLVSCPHLQSINFHGCNNITPAAIESLSQRHIQLVSR